MAGKDKKPEIRFTGFTDAWEQRKLGDVVNLENGFAFKSEYFQDEPTDVIVLTPGNVNIGGGFQKGKGHFYDVSGKFPNKFILGPKDIFVTMTDLTPSGQALGFPAVVPDDSNTYLHNQRLGKLTNFEGDKSFLLQLLSTEQNHKQIVLTASGTTVKHSSPQKILDCTNYFPSKKEQNQIGTFLTNLDNLITLHERKYDKLVIVKKSMLEKMFPKDGANVPEIRFAGFADVWEQRKFNDIVQKLTGGASIKPDDYQESGVRTIPKGAINSSGVADLSSSKHITHAFFEKNISSRVSTGDLVTSLRDLVPTAPNMGRIVRIKGIKEAFLMPQGVYRIELQNDVDEDFMIAFSNSDKYRKIISAEKNGSTQVHIRNGEFLNIEIQTPNHEEQTKIGMFFKQLDNTIALHQREFEKLKNIKKSMLEKMFV